MGLFQKLIDQALMKVSMQAVTLLKSKYGRAGDIYYDKGKNQIVWSRVILGKNPDGQNPTKITQEARITCWVANNWTVEVIVEGVFRNAHITSYEIEIFDAKSILEVCDYIHDSKWVINLDHKFRFWKVMP